MKSHLTLTFVSLLVLSLGVILAQWDLTDKGLNQAAGQSQPPPPLEKDGPAIKGKGVLKIPSPFKGILTRLMVQEGQAVKKGDILAQIDNRLAKAELKIILAKMEIAKAEFESAQATVDEAKAQYERIKKLPPAAVAKEDIGMKQLSLVKSQNEMKSREAAVNLVKMEVEKAEIFLSLFDIQSPVDGTVQNIRMQPGEAVGELETVVEVAASTKKQ